jgi:anti-sigma-K factor RskA
VSVHREEHLYLCAGYVLGALDDADGRELDLHLAKGCSECEAELRRLADGATMLAASAPQVSPPPALKLSVLERVRTEGVKRAPTPTSAARVGKESRRVIELPQRRPPVMTWAWAAAAAVLAVTSLVTWQAAERLRGDLAAARTQLEAQRQQIAQAEQQLAEERRWSAMMESSDARVVDMQLTPQGSALLRARAIYDPKTHQAMIVFTNFAPPPGSDYELWALRGGPPQSLGLIHADASGRAIVKLPDTGDPARLAAFAVSLEKAGGSTSPSGPEGPVVMVGKLAGS